VGSTEFWGMVNLLFFVGSNQKAFNWRGRCFPTWKEASHAHGERRRRGGKVGGVLNSGASEIPYPMMSKKKCARCFVRRVEVKGKEGWGSGQAVRGKGPGNMGGGWVQLE